MKDLIDHQEIDEELKKLTWVRTDDTSQTVSPYYGYGIWDVRYEYETNAPNGFADATMFKIFPTGERLRLSKYFGGTAAGEIYREIDYALRHDHFNLEWDEMLWHNRAGDWLRGKLPKNLQMGSIMTAKYENKPAVKITLKELESPGGFKLIAQYADNSALASGGVFEVFQDLKDLPQVFKKFKDTVRLAFKTDMANKQLAYAENSAKNDRAAKKDPSNSKRFRWPGR